MSDASPSFVSFVSQVLEQKVTMVLTLLASLASYHSPAIASVTYLHDNEDSHTALRTKPWRFGNDSKVRHRCCVFVIASYQE
jgi:hypothetical protein